MVVVANFLFLSPSANFSFVPSPDLKALKPVAVTVGKICLRRFNWYFNTLFQAPSFTKPTTMKLLLFSFLLFQVNLFSQWTLSTAQMGASFACNSVANDGKMYIIGGPKTNNLAGALDLKLYAFDFATETITIVPGGLSSNRYGSSISVFNGKIYLAGGSSVLGNSFISHDVIDIYEIATQTWSTKKLPRKKDGFLSVPFNNKIIYPGGYQGVAVTDFVDIYTPATDTWEVQKLSVARAECAAAISNGKVYFCGGTTKYSPYVASSRIDIYDPAQPVGSQWTTAELSQPRVAPVSIAFGDTIMVAGGYSASMSKSDRIDIINTKTGQITQGALSEGRAYLTAQMVGKKVYFAGGGNYLQTTYYFNESSNVVDVYDTETKTWTKQTLNNARMSHASSAWGNKIVVAGGWRASTASTLGTLEVLTDNSVSVEIVSLNDLGLAIYPNPTADYLILNTHDNLSADISEIAIMDASGKTIWNEKGIEQEIFTQKRIDLGVYPAGQYYLRTTSKNGRQRATTGFIIQK
jgi:hypothetical protein